MRTPEKAGRKALSTTGKERKVEERSRQIEFYGISPRKQLENRAEKQRHVKLGQRNLKMGWRVGGRYKMGLKIVFQI